MKRQSLYWFVLAAAGFAVAFAPLPFLPSAAATPAARTFRIEASQFAYSPADLHVDPGDHVTIELVSMDVTHGLYVDGYGMSTESDPGQSSKLTFIADRPGSYRFRCNVTCGAMHPFMIGRLQVGTDVALFRGIGLALVGAAGILLFNQRQPLGSGMLV